MKQVFASLAATALLLCSTASAQLDSTFATNGIYKNALGAGTTDAFSDVARQSDGKLVSCGYFRLSDGTYKAIVQRFDSTGVLDNSFSSDGAVTQSAVYNCAWYAVAIQADGKIVVAGYVKPDQGVQNATLVARFNADGTTDNDFGAGGTAFVDINTGADDHAESLCIQPDGSILVGGKYSNGSLYKPFIYRLTAAGVLDNTFNSTGKLLINTALTHNEGSINKIIYYNNKIYFTYNDAMDIRVRRLNTNGSDDSSFGAASNGLFVYSFGSNIDKVYDMSIDADGKIVVAGNSYVSQQGNLGIVFRIKADGSALDNTFGVDGTNSFNMGNTANQSFCRGIHQRADGHYWVSAYYEEWVGETPIPAQHAALLLDANGGMVPYWGDGGILTIATTTGSDYTAGSIAWGDRLLLFGHANEDNAMLKFKRGMIQTGVEAPAFAATLSPNPAREVLYIAAEQPLTGELHSLLGATVARYDGTGVLNLSGIAPGMYLLTLRDAQGQTATQRVVVK